MSGFVAVVNADGAPVDRGLLARLTDAMAFRGPDARRVWSDGPVGLGHTLLATVDDYPEVPQPCSLDGQVWLAGDVRVDGRAELVAQLEDRVRAPLAAASDPELVLHAYGVWGEGCVEHLIGDFAFALWDGARKRLFCARDHMGVKPLYYARTPRGALVLSNTLDAVRLHPDVSGELNDETIGDFLLFGRVVEPTATGFAHVQRLAAAHTLSWERGEPRTARYWSLPIEPPVHYRRAADYVDRFAELLRVAVDDRLRTSRLSISMSGGLDSTAVAATVRTLQPSAQLRAYTSVSDGLIKDDERHYAGCAARHLGIPIRFRDTGGFQPYHAPARHPMRTPVPLHEPLWGNYTAEHARTAGESRVVLTGFGGDPALLPWPGELLEQVRRLRWAAASRTLWQFARTNRGLPKLGLRTAVTHAFARRSVAPAWPDWIEPEFRARVHARTRAQARALARGPDHPYRMTAYESLADPFWDFLFEMYDASVTRCGLEFRHPLLDVRLLRYALTLPTLPYCVEKHTLREALRGALPEEVRLRPKTPLREDPLLASLRRTTASIADVRLAAELSRFVRVDRLPPPESLPSSSGGVWLHLRPHSLSWWLDSTNVVSRATFAPESTLAVA